MVTLAIILSIFGLAAGQTREISNTVPGEPSTSKDEILSQLTQQVFLQQLFVEERIRSDGGSGIKQMRVTNDGTRPYYSPTHGGRSVAAIHNHAHYISTLGLGEFIAVLNGVEFRTRHNDYKLVMSSRTSKDYHATEPIPFPEVPPEVKNKASIAAQVDEMKLWFKAFKDQDYSVRDYRRYFQPVLCYLEGHWTYAGDEIEESFDSDRHQIDAKSWFDLQQKIQFTSYSGSKSNLENFAYLPTTIIEVRNGTPIFAQWNYRILCQHLKDDLPLNRLRAVDDIAARMMQRRNFEEYEKSRAARFQVNPFDDFPWLEGKERHGLLDELMGQVPGVDNYQGVLSDDAFDIPAYEAENIDKVLNAAYYHRFYKSKKKGAMGLQLRKRSFSDPNVFMAMTSNERVPAVGYEHCYNKGRGRRKTVICSKYYQRWTYAVPLEIVYMTPLYKWNPYNIEYKGKDNSQLGKYVKTNGRNGAQQVDKAYNGTSASMYAWTPVEFFSNDGIDNGDAADTEKKPVAVLDKSGTMRMVHSSGTRINSNIPGVGVIRYRYPIMPVHGEGGNLWKQFDALKDIILSPLKYRHMFREPLDLKEDENTQTPEEQNIKGVTLLMQAKPGAAHTHTIELSGEEVALLKKGKTVNTLGEEAYGHSHNVKIAFNPNGKYVMRRCDGAPSCEHFRVLSVIATQ